jgi:hypothetical protein
LAVRSDRSSRPPARGPCPQRCRRIAPLLRR